LPGHVVPITVTESVITGSNQDHAKYFSQRIQAIQYSSSRRMMHSSASTPDGLVRSHQATVVEEQTVVAPQPILSTHCPPPHPGAIAPIAFHPVGQVSFIQCSDFTGMVLENVFWNFLLFAGT
jgi:hypothetical protein